MAFQFQELGLQAEALGSGVASEGSAGGDDSVAGDEDWEAVGGHDRADGSCRAGAVSSGGQFAVGDRFAVLEFSCDVNNLSLEWGELRGMQLDVIECDAFPGSVTLEAMSEFREPVGGLRVDWLSVVGIGEGGLSRTRVGMANRHCVNNSIAPQDGPVPQRGGKCRNT